MENSSSVHSQRLVVKIRLPKCGDLAQKLATLEELERCAASQVNQGEFSLAKYLCEIYGTSLYKARGHKSFGTYIEANRAIYGIGCRQAYRILKGAHVLTHLKDHRRPPIGERQVCGSCPYAM